MAEQVTACRRKVRRHRLGAESSKIEFGYPGFAGERLSMPVLDLSLSGFSFRLTASLPDFEVGASITAAMLRVNGTEIDGDMVVMHISDSAATGAVCGVLFYPETDTDLIKLKSVIAGIEAIDPQ